MGREGSAVQIKKHLPDKSSGRRETRGTTSVQGFIAESLLRRPQTVSGVPAIAYWQHCVGDRAPRCIPRVLRYRLAPTGDSLYRGMMRVLVLINAYGRIIKRVHPVVKSKL